jgi:hypothetical protein
MKALGQTKYTIFQIKTTTGFKMIKTYRHMESWVKHYSSPYAMESIITRNVIDTFHDFLTW